MACRTGDNKVENMRTRKHHNNKGLKQVKNGKAYRRLKRFAKKLKIKWGIK